MNDRAPAVDRIVDKRGLVEALFPHASGRNSKFVRCGDAMGNPSRRGKHAGSFSVNREDGYWTDFNTGEKGDLVDLVATRLQASVPDAIRWLRDNGWIREEGVDMAQHDRDRTPPPGPPPEPEWRTLDPGELPIPTDEACLRAAETLRGRGREQWQFVATGVAARYVYEDDDGRPLVVLVRYETANGKEPRPLTWRNGAWRPGGTEMATVPIYRARAVAADPELPVLVVEGEKAADAGADLFTDRVTCCPMGGSSPRAGTDWSPLWGRKVTVVADNDSAGRKFMGILRAALKGLTDGPVQQVRPIKMWESMGGTGTPPAGWDIADGVPQPDSPPVAADEPAGDGEPTTCSVCGREREWHDIGVQAGVRLCADCWACDTRPEDMCDPTLPHVRPDGVICPAGRHG